MLYGPSAGPDSINLHLAGVMVAFSFAFRIIKDRWLSGIAVKELGD
jgi:hypothetical protein